MRRAIAEQKVQAAGGYSDVTGRGLYVRMRVRVSVNARMLHMGTPSRKKADVTWVAPPCRPLGHAARGHI